MSYLDFSDPRSAQLPRLRWHFGKPRQVLTATCLADVPTVLEQAEQQARAGAWVLGWLAYEAAPAMDAALQVHPPPVGSLLAWFAVHDGPVPEGEEAASASKTQPQPDWQAQWQPGLERTQFDDLLAQVQAGIARGDFYQVNLTHVVQGSLEGSSQALFAALQQAQPGGYAAHLVMEPAQAAPEGQGAPAHSPATGPVVQEILSVSPELFFDWHADAQGQGPILTRPMKGTAARGATPEQDAAQAQALQASPKERAENVMIVDLLRNDVSRLATPHSVQVPQLLHVQALPTAWQMTSDVCAQTRTGTRLRDVFAALFPCGSVTGAPKVQAMRQIAALEAGPRGVYCGALGLLRPDPALGPGSLAATFNVPIRTLALAGTALRCGIGSGLVWGAQPEGEWQEWAVKRRFVERASAPFSLLETLGLHDGQWRHLHAHLQRMQRSAAHFGFPWDAQQVQTCLAALAQTHAQGAWRVRLLLNAQGQYQAEAAPLAATATPVRLALANRPFAQAHSEFTCHKTTRRSHYAAFAPAAGSGIFDTVLYNPAGQITESTFGNLAMLLDGQWYTPPLACGLLPGIGRAQALQAGWLREAIVRLEDVPRIQGWQFINSLRGCLPAQLYAGE